MRIQLLKQLQDDGNPIEMVGDVYLVVGTDNLKSAQIITGSDLRSGTAENDVNIYSGGAVKVMHSRWLDNDLGGSDTAWYLVAPSVAKLHLVMRQDAELDQQVNQNTKSTLFDLVLDFSVGSAAWHGVVGSKGDSTSYSS